MLNTSCGNRVTHFALIDDVVEAEANGSMRSFYLLDCITFEAALQLKNKTWSNISQGSEFFDNTMIISVELHDLRRALPNLPSDGQWLSFHLADEKDNLAFREGAIPASFVNLSGTTEETAMPRFFLSGITVVGSPFERLALLTGLNSRKHEITVALDDPIRRYLRRDQRNIIVYDIGQGSATALVDIHGRPVIYFDLGWPTSLNRATRPIDPPLLFAAEACPYCRGHASSSAPVILSHWDFDHWAYAVENDGYNYGKKAAKMVFKPAALARTWIVPKPPRIKNTKGLGPTHMRLLTAMKSRLFWPNTLHSVSFAAGVVSRTDTKKAPTDRNNQGLAWFVKNPASTDAILLPGDISFDHLRMPRPPTKITGLLASHHGGEVSGILSTLSHVSSGATMVLSVGAGNIHGHPLRNILANYAAAGWINDTRTSTRSVSRLSAPQQNGSILIQLDHSDPKPHFCCTCMHEGNLVPTQ